MGIRARRAPRCGSITRWPRFLGGAGRRAVVTASGGATGARSPRPYFDRLVAAVERLNAARSLSRQLRVLAEEAPTITNEQLADRLLALADRLRALP
jgi:hypothetical protein